MPDYVKVAATDDIPPNQGKLVEIGEKRIALFNLDGKYYAIDNTCTHQGGPLADGYLEGDVVTCPWHGAQFKVASGEVVSPPASQGVKSFPVRVTGNDVEVEIEK